MARVAHLSVFFTGHVQGVGFRYTTLAIAKEYEVAGYVTNLPDGRVQLEAEGAEREVKSFVGAVKERMHGYIRKTEERQDQREPQFQGFTLR